MERKYNNIDKLQKAGEILEQKGLDLNEYTIFDTSGKFNYCHMANRLCRVVWW